ncbi:hypothetical protein QYE76_071266 [Lolium multiflorum]|uniref:Uncharacterized protein n=1 Tax=Lolium multiflorum TaxID=4521 RepID=A0AAD8WEG1_LOLMU|nr:hypothetical protein QYE76_071266 [Lolium multiflorum]
MIGTEVVAVFLKRRIQPVMSRAHQMWLYSGPMDETRVNVAELSEKELLDETPSTAEYFPTLSEDEENLEEGDSTANVESGTGVIKVNEALLEEDIDPASHEASSAVHRTFDGALFDTAESNHGNEADRAPFVRASPEKASAQQPKRSSGDFADENDLLLDFSSKLDRAVTIGATARREADVLRKELDQLNKKMKEEEKEMAEAQAKWKEKEDLLQKSIMALLEAADISSSSTGKLPAKYSADAISLAIESSVRVQALLQKNKVVMSRLHAVILPKADQQKTLKQLADTSSVKTEGTIEVVPVPSFVESSSAGDSESD